MVDDSLKQEIQAAYTGFLNAKNLKARYGQRLMIAHIARTLSAIPTDEAGQRMGGKPLAVVEAGTGTGKTLAYLIAALPIARSRRKTLVVSTATVALQEQILLRDIPDIIEHSGLDFDFALAKGRQRYLCHARLDQQLSGGGSQNQLLYPDEVAAQPEAQQVKLFHSMADALARNTWDGDRDQWPDAVDDEAWQRVTTEPAQCTGRRCSFIRECAFFRARENLLDVDVIVANHDLVLADLALGGGAILPPPEDVIYVFDEAHHLPDKVINHFSFQVRFFATERWLEQTLRAVRGMAEQLPQGEQRALIDGLAGQMSALLELQREASPLISSIVNEGLEARGGGDVLRFEHGIVPDLLRRQATELMQACSGVLAEADDVQEAFEEALDKRSKQIDRELLEQWLAAVATIQRRVEQQMGLWCNYQSAGEAENPPLARWVKLVEGLSAAGDMDLCCSPILAANTLISTLWKRCYGAVLTSATLTALGEFERLSMRAGLTDLSECAVVPSPFIHQEKAELRVPAMPCDAGDALAHTEALIDMMPELLRQERGTLALFASWRQMLAVYDGLDADLQAQILKQGEHSKHEMIKQHCERIDRGEYSTLFGLASFAEGVDLPGDYCRHVIIAKLPFAPPDDPVEQALAEWIEKNKGNAFMEISVPDAALKLVQASGRLLRKESDSGHITLLDRRVLTRRYGQKMLDSLPPFRRVFET